MFNSGQEMEALMLSWFILTETGSPFLVGLLGALRFGGTARSTVCLAIVWTVASS